MCEHLEPPEGGSPMTSPRNWRPMRWLRVCLAVMTGLLTALPPLVSAQELERPSLYWAQYDLDLSQDDCIARARQALDTEGLQGIEDGRLPTGTIRYAMGRTSRFNAWILCRRAGNATLGTVMVGGPQTDGASTEKMKNDLRDFMMGRPATDAVADGATDALSGYTRIPRALVRFGFRDLKNIRPAECAAACDNTDRCKSFDYNTAARSCQLNSATSASSNFVQQGDGSVMVLYEKLGTTIDAMTAERQVGGDPTDMRGWDVDRGSLQFKDTDGVEHVGPSDGYTSYYVAPGRFHGDWRGYSTLRFEKTSSGGSYYGPDRFRAAGDVVLSNGDMWARFDLSPHHDGSWRTYAVPLDSRLWSFGGGASRLSDVLRNVTEFKIRAEYGEGRDRSGLRRVELER